ncbi:MAG: HNH endonuclease [Pseudomonadota bacterium]
MNEQGYILITVDRSIHRAHRLAWVYIHGSAPCGDIDHINGIRSDNRICNLRDVSHTVNLQNRKGATVSSKSGILGVRKHRACDKWEARIKVAGKQRYLGLYETAEEAREAYLSAKRQFHAGNTL